MANKVHSKMAQAFINAADKIVAQGGDVGYVGQRVLTNKIMGIGQMRPRETIKLKKKAEAAVSGNVGVMA